MREGKIRDANRKEICSRLVLVAIKASTTRASSALHRVSLTNTRPC